MAKNLIKRSIISLLTTLVLAYPSNAEINGKTGLQSEKSSYSACANLIWIDMNLSIRDGKYTANVVSTDYIPFVEFDYKIFSKGIVKNNQLVPLETIVIEGGKNESRSTYKNNKLFFQKKVRGEYKYTVIFDSSSKDLISVIYNFRLNDLSKTAEIKEQVYFADLLLTLDAKIKKSEKGYKIILNKDSKNEKKERYIVLMDFNNNVLELERIEPKKGQFKVKSKKV